MKYSLSLLLLFTTATAISSAQSNSIENPVDERPSLPTYLDLQECTVQLIQDIDLPALESGQIIAIDVKPGVSVKKDQIVAQMDDSRSQRTLEEATLRHGIADRRASDETEEQTAYKRYRLAYIEHTKAEKLQQSGSVSEHNANRARYSAEVAQLEFEGAQRPASCPVSKQQLKWFESRRRKTVSLATASRLRSTARWWKCREKLVSGSPREKR